MKGKLKAEDINNIRFRDYFELVKFGGVSQNNEDEPLGHFHFENAHVKGKRPGDFEELMKSMGLEYHDQVFVLAKLMAERLIDAAANHNNDQHNNDRLITNIEMASERS